MTKQTKGVRDSSLRSERKPPDTRDAGRKRNRHSQPELTAILRTLLGFCLSATTRAEGEDIALS